MLNVLFKITVENLIFSNAQRNRELKINNYFSMGKIRDKASQIQQ